MPELLIVLVIILIIVGGVGGWYASEKRKKDLAAWAAGRGLSFDPAKDYAMEDRFPGFNCFRKGSRRYAHNVMRGQWGDREIAAFDYHYETYSRDSKGRRTTHHHRFSAVILRSGVPLRPLFIRPEGFFDRVTEFFGYDDIDFESAEFSRKFYVKSPDKKWAFDVIHARTMQFLLDSPTFTISFDRDHVIAFRGRRFRPADYQSAADLLAGLLDRLPEYVRRQQLGQG